MHVSNPYISAGRRILFLNPLLTSMNKFLPLIILASDPMTHLPFTALPYFSSISSCLYKTVPKYLNSFTSYIFTPPRTTSHLPNDGTLTFYGVSKSTTSTSLLSKVITLLFPVFTFIFLVVQHYKIHPLLFEVPFHSLQTTQCHLQTSMHYYSTNYVHF